MLIADAEKKVAALKDNVLYKNAFEWRFEFPEVLDDEGNYIGFDVMIGNPPYIYNRDLPEQTRSQLQEKYAFADDLYTYFIVEGLNILKEKGLFH